MPDGPAVQMFGQSSTSPFRVIRGPLVNEVHILHALVLQRLSLYSFGFLIYNLIFNVVICNIIIPNCILFFYKSNIALV